ncbi:MAG: hypothetical protein DMF95_13370 [Acidobacteria bacterium]|nr:MAG: hypothetical protein DMF95_13370 [Acidobacteriota bacterium]
MAMAKRTFSTYCLQSRTRSLKTRTNSREPGIIQRLGHRHAAAQGQRVCAFGDEPLRLGVDAGLLEQSGEHEKSDALLPPHSRSVMRDTICD